MTLCDGMLPRHPAGGRELLNHVADIAKVLANPLAQHEGDHRRGADQADCTSIHR
jgi:hypothetical protein